jgi:hypothetical protein
MKYIIIILFLFTSSIASGEELELNCKFDNYNAVSRNYTHRVIKSWSPPIQNHIINTDNTSYWHQWRIDGKVVTNDSKKIKFKYETKTQQGITRWTFIFFKTSKKAAIDMEFSGYIAPGTIWGSCEETKSNYEKPVKNSNTNNDSLEKISDKLVCYRYGLYNGKYITEAKRRNLNCTSENEEKTNSSDKITNKTEEAENKCKELGFTPATESYGNCVLKLMD